MTPLLWWLAAVNAAGFFLMGADKRRAARGQWRVPERGFFLLALAGGAAGCLLGMAVFRHKTRHRKFTWGLPALLAAQSALAYLLYARGAL